MNMNYEEDFQVDPKIEDKVEEVLKIYENQVEGLYHILRNKGMQTDPRFLKQFVKETFSVEFEEDETSQKYYQFVILLWNALVFYHNNLNNVISLQEAAEMLEVDDSTLRKAIARGDFDENDYRKTGRNYIINKSVVLRWAKRESKNT